MAFGERMCFSPDAPPPMEHWTMSLYHPIARCWPIDTRMSSNVSDQWDIGELEIIEGDAI